MNAINKFLMTGAVVLLVFLVLTLSALPVVAETVDSIAVEKCSKCDVTSTAMVAYKRDQAICPGNNAVICRYRFLENTASECLAEGPEDDAIDLMLNCKTTNEVKTYPTKNYPINTCGVKGVNGVRCSAVAAAAGRAHKGSSKGCKGAPWLMGAAFESTRLYPIEVRSHGRSSEIKGDGEARIERISISIPAGLIRAELAKLKKRPEIFKIDLELSLPTASRFAIVDQELEVSVSQKEARVSDLLLKDGKIKLRLDVVVEWLSAYAGYDVVLHELAITAAASPSLIVAPQAVGKKRKTSDSETMTSMILLAEAFAGKRLLSSGAAKVAYWLSADH